jgi:hypothetical protein
VGKIGGNVKQLQEIPLNEDLLLKICIGNHAMLLVQLGINSTSDVWNTYFSMSTSYSLAKAQSCQTFNQNLVLLFVFSFSSFVKANFGAFLRIFI